MPHPVLVRADHLRNRRDGERIYCLTLLDIPYHPGCLFYFPYVRSGTLDRSVETEGEIPGYIRTCVEFSGTFRFEKDFHALLKLPPLAGEQAEQLLRQERGTPTEFFRDPQDLKVLFDRIRIVLIALQVNLASHERLLKQMPPDFRLLFERCSPFLEPGYVIIPDTPCHTP